MDERPIRRRTSSGDPGGRRCHAVRPLSTPLTAGVALLLTAAAHAVGWPVVAGGVATFRQTVARPVLAWNPYRAPVDGAYLCSSATPPGAGVHGMCGVYAARTALHDHFGGPPPFSR